MSKTQLFSSNNISYRCISWQLVGQTAIVAPIWSSFLKGFGTTQLSPGLWIMISQEDFPLLTLGLSETTSLVAPDGTGRPNKAASIRGNMNLCFTDGVCVWAGRVKEYMIIAARSKHPYWLETGLILRQKEYPCNLYKQVIYVMLTLNPLDTEISLLSTSVTSYRKWPLS